VLDLMALGVPLTIVTLIRGLAITSDERDLRRRTVRQAGKVGGRRPG
jgi:hypothetical protein